MIEFTNNKDKYVEKREVKDGKWYGWSHRAINGFEIGDTVKRGDIAYTSDDVHELIEDYARFFSNVSSDIEKIESRYKELVEGCTVSECGSYFKSKNHPNMEAIKTGRGEWTAETEEDAKQMAIDFANGVA